jgi:hypothetical protein
MSDDKLDGTCGNPVEDCRLFFHPPSSLPPLPLCRAPPLRGVDVARRLACPAHQGIPREERTSHRWGVPIVANRRPRPCDPILVLGKWEPCLAPGGIGRKLSFLNEEGPRMHHLTGRAMVTLVS